MNQINVKTCVLGMVSTNCYLVYNQKSAVIIDPADNSAYILEQCRTLGVEPVAILLTHGHFDHILATRDITRSFPVPVYASEAEQQLLETPDMNLSISFMKPFSLTPDVLIKDGQELELLGLQWKVIATPGHTAGCVSYYLPEEHMLFSGDTLFEGTFGRTDVPTSSTEDIVHSITEKLFGLPEETTVYPGHGDTTSIGHEKQCNPIKHYRKG